MAPKSCPPRSGRAHSPNGSVARTRNTSLYALRNARIHALVYTRLLFASESVRGTTCSARNFDFFAFENGWTSTASGVSAKLTLESIVFVLFLEKHTDDAHRPIDSKRSNGKTISGRSRIIEILWSRRKYPAAVIIRYDISAFNEAC